VVEGEISPRLENPTPLWKNKFKVRVVSERCSAYPDATGWSGSAAADPAPAVKSDLISTWRIKAHGLIAIRGKEQVSMVGGYNGLFDADGGKFTNRPRQIIDYCIHHLAGLKRESRLACVIDLL
jgi:hypothetical protein